jgi:hypothetical protein
MKRNFVLPSVIWIGLLAAGVVCAQTPKPAGSAAKVPTTREMNLLCWQEFSELVPGIRTVLLPIAGLSQ